MKPAFLSAFVPVAFVLGTVTAHPQDLTNPQGGLELVAWLKGCWVSADGTRMVWDGSKDGALRSTGEPADNNHFIKAQISIQDARLLLSMTYNSGKSSAALPVVKLTPDAVAFQEPAPVPKTIVGPTTYLFQHKATDQLAYTLTTSGGIDAIKIETDFRRCTTQEAAETPWGKRRYR